MIFDCRFIHLVKNSFILLEILFILVRYSLILRLKIHFVKCLVEMWIFSQNLEKWQKLYIWQILRKYYEGIRREFLRNSCYLRHNDFGENSSTIFTWREKYTTGLPDIICISVDTIQMIFFTIFKYSLLSVLYWKQYTEKNSSRNFTQILARLGHMD